MLVSLHIENIAVIKRTDIDFSHGFTAMTGETGAGKSIIIDSINLLLGAKSDKDLVRHGESYAMVSGLFSNLNSVAISTLSDAGVYVDDDGNILIQRTVFLDGKSQIKINGRTVTLAILKRISADLIAIHGQHDTASLSDRATHLEIIDTYANNSALIEEYKEIYSKLEQTRKSIEEIVKKESERERLVEILKYQINDIDSLSLHEGEEEELIDKKLKIKNSEKISKNAGFVFKALKGSEKGSVSFLLDKSIASLEHLTDVIPEATEYITSLRDCLYRIEDVAQEVYAVISDMDDDPEDSLNKIESRLDKISRLKKKYGFSIAEILEFRDKSKAELDLITDSDAVLKSLRKKEAEIYEEALGKANVIHERRVCASKEIERSVKETLSFLDMPKVTFFADIREEYKNGAKLLNGKGCDSVEFYISTNSGAEAMPLGKIASGGELARIMLALKTAISGKESVETLIFDEIDAGVSGKTARKIGIKMLLLAKKSQLLCVTHSAQIASLADEHFLIKKEDVDSKTVTKVTALDREGRIEELSRILGGINVTESQRMAAQDMLSERESYL